MSLRFVGAFYLFCLIFILGFNSILEAKQTEIPIDNDPVDIRIPEPQVLEEIFNDSRYFYNEKIQNQPTLWDKFRFWALRTIGSFLDNSWVGKFFDIALILTFLALLWFLLNRFASGDIKSAISGKTNRNFSVLKINPISESGDQLDTLLKNAIEKKQFHDAVRYLYQKALQQLSQKDLIKWKADKTNHEYRYELGNHPTASSFDRLTYFYEYVDYGDFEIEEKGFETVQKVYAQFVSKLGGNS